MHFIYAFIIIVLAVPVSAAAEDSRLVRADRSEMALIPAGDFLMGSPDPVVYPTEETPRHKVYLDAFFMDIYEITNEKFAAFLNAVKASGKHPIFDDERQKWVVIRNDLEKIERQDWWPTEILYEKGEYKVVRGFERYPVISVSWSAADAYCNWAGKRLPTEAEWEKAARGGLDGKEYPWGNEVPTGGIIFKREWKNSFSPPPVETVGNYYPNGYGLFDVAGNVSEWCSDWYNSAYYSKSPDKNPKGPETGINKVVRGGSWAGTALNLRVSFRNFSLPDRLNSGVGIRCASDSVK